MKKFLHNFANTLHTIGIVRLGVVALVIRLILAIPFYSGDLNNPAIWGIYAREFGFSGFYDFLSFGNYSRPDYPPLAIILFWAIRGLWEVLFAAFWWLNITIPIFPSNFIPWFEKDGYILLLKLPGLIGDFLLGVLLYKYFVRANKKLATVAAALYWANPATIYVSSMWGQVDGIVIPLAVASLILFEQKRLVWSLFLFTGSILIKPTMLMITPVLVYLLIKNRKEWLSIVRAMVVSGMFAVAVVWLFAPWNPVGWLATNYFPKFVWGISANLPYIQIRAFNFWTLLTGSQFISIETQWLGVTLYWWALILSLLVFSILFILLLKKKEYWGAAALLIFASFLFLPRVHERYLLPILPFLLVFCLKYPKVLWTYLAVSLLHIFNLYVAWGVPNTPILEILRLDVFARISSALFVILFLWIARYYVGLPHRQDTQNLSRRY